MMTWIREKFGTIVIAGIISFIAFVFIFSGVFSPRSTRGLHEGSVAGLVNGDPITISEFNREVNRRMEFFKNMGGGLTEEQIKSFGVRKMVFEDLVRRKLLYQEAESRGLLASSAAIKDQIKKIPAFQKDGHFDLETYKKVLELNSYSPGYFEKNIREDLSVQKMDQFLRSHIKVSDQEVKREYELTQNQRKFKYVPVTAEAVKKDISVSEKELKDFLENEKSMNLVKEKYEAGRYTLYKDQGFDAVRDQIAKMVIADGKTEELQQKLKTLADTVLAMVSKQSSLSVEQLNRNLKKYSLEAKESKFLDQKQPFLEGFGKVSELFNEAFSGNQKTTPKIYRQGNRYLIAWTSDVQTPDMKKFDAEKSSLMQSLVAKKTNGVYQAFMTRLRDQSKIEPNAEVVAE